MIIPGIETVHPRSEWVDKAYPVSGPPIQWAKIDTNVAHYTADDDLIDGDPSEHADELPQYLRDMQRSYINTRGYSVGYLWAVDWLGGAWQLRGWEYQSAANKGWNARTIPVLYLVDGQDRLTTEAAHTGSMLYREAERLAGRYLGRPRPHSSIGATRCPGDGIRLDINAGLLDPREPDPEPLPPDEEPDVLVAIYEPNFSSPGYDPATFLVYSNGAVRRATNPDMEFVKTLSGVLKFKHTSAEQYNDMLAISGSKYPPYGG